MELTSGARIGIVGGGPAGTFTAYFLLDLAQRLGLRLQVEILEPREFYRTGPTGCNMCGGVISESLVQMLATDGIHLPRSVVIDTIDAYTLHTSRGSVRIPAQHQEKRIASIYRGGGPKGAETQLPLPWDSFDWFLLQRAVQMGAIHIPQRVTGLSWEEGKPRVETEKGDGRVYDLLVGAVGLNSPALHLFEAMGFGYRPPKNVRAFIAELYYGNRAVDHILQGAMHIFLLDIPRLKFAALTPKGHYATFIILGDDVDRELAEETMRTPAVRNLFPTGWEIPVLPCQCQPRINVGDPRNAFTDRVVMVGDCTVSRLYKDGIGAAYRTAKACATTALTHGVSRDAFQNYFWPTCRRISRDNTLGHMLFGADHLLQGIPHFRNGILNSVRHEQNLPGGADTPRLLSSALWDTFTGSAPYTDICLRAMRPSVVTRLGWETMKSILAG